MEDVFGFITRGTVIVGIFLAAFWKGDDLLSESGRELLYNSLISTLDSPFRPLNIMDKYFSIKLPAVKFVLNTFIFSSAAAAVLFIAYTAMHPGFSMQLLEDKTARALFFRQFFLDGIVTIFVVNYMGFVTYACFVETKKDNYNFKLHYLIMIDIFARVLSFFIVTSIVYLIFAHWFGSFEGDEVLALKTVSLTLVDAVTFDNLTGIYLYATAISSLPLFLGACIDIMQENPRASRLIRGAFFFLPFKNRPIRAIAVVVGVFFVLFGCLVFITANII